MYQLRPIRNETEYDEAVAEIERLWSADPGTPESDRLAVLGMLVDAYEREHHAIAPPSAEVAAAFRTEQSVATSLSYGRVSLHPPDPSAGYHNLFPVAHAPELIGAVAAHRALLLGLTRQTNVAGTGAGIAAGLGALLGATIVGLVDSLWMSSTECVDPPTERRAGTSLPKYTVEQFGTRASEPRATRITGSLLQLKYDADLAEVS